MSPPVPAENRKRRFGLTHYANLVRVIREQGGTEEDGVRGILDILEGGDPTFNRAEFLARCNREDG